MRETKETLEFKKTCPAHKINTDNNGRTYEAWSCNICIKTKCQYSKECSTRDMAKRWI